MKGLKEIPSPGLCSRSRPELDSGLPVLPPFPPSPQSLSSMQLPLPLALTTEAHSSPHCLGSLGIAYQLVWPAHYSSLSASGNLDGGYTGFGSVSKSVFLGRISTVPVSSYNPTTASPAET